MTKPLRFDDEAVEELNAAAEWYEARREKLGLEFVGAIREALLRITTNPQTWPSNSTSVVTSCVDSLTLSSSSI